MKRVKDITFFKNDNLSVLEEELCSGVSVNDNIVIPLLNILLQIRRKVEKKSKSLQNAQRVSHRICFIFTSQNVLENIASFLARVFKCQSNYN